MPSEPLPPDIQKIIEWGRQVVASRPPLRSDPVETRYHMKFAFTTAGLAGLVGIVAHSASSVSANLALFGAIKDDNAVDGQSNGCVGAYNWEVQNPPV